MSKSRYDAFDRYSSYLEARRAYIDGPQLEEEGSVLYRFRFDPVEEITVKREEEEEAEAEVEDQEAVDDEEEHVIQEQISEQEGESSRADIIIVPTTTVCADKNNDKEDQSEILNTKEDEANVSEEMNSNSNYSNGKPYQRKFSQSDTNIPKTIGIVWTKFMYSLFTFVSVVFLIACTRAVVYQSKEYVNNSWFCRWFMGPFRPLFDAICEQHAATFGERVPKEMSLVLDQIVDGIIQAADNVKDGFKVFRTIFHAITNGIENNITAAIYELFENVYENLHYLTNFLEKMGIMFKNFYKVDEHHVHNFPSAPEPDFVNDLD